METIWICIHRLINMENAVGFWSSNEIFIHSGILMCVLWWHEPISYDACYNHIISITLSYYFSYAQSCEIMCILHWNTSLSLLSCSCNNIVIFTNMNNFALSIASKSKCCTENKLRHFIETFSFLPIKSWSWQLTHSCIEYSYIPQYW